MSFAHTDDYTAPHGGTAIPGTNPDGYMLGPDDGTMTWFAGTLVTFRAKAADTRGVLSFFQCDVPNGWQAPVHRHAGESEGFHITEGEWEIFVNDTVHLVTPGCTVWIPQSTAHSIFVRSQRGRGYCVIPPAGFEKFFEDLGEPATMPTHQTRDPSIEELPAGGQALGWELVEPRPRRLPGARD